MTLAAGFTRGLGGNISDLGRGLLGGWAGSRRRQEVFRDIISNPLVAGVVGFRWPISARQGEWRHATDGAR